MKYSAYRIIVLLLLLTGFSRGYTQDTGRKTVRLFLIGNSFSQNATRYLPQLAQEGGFTLSIGRAELGGCSLQRHWELVEAAEAGDPKGKAYNGKSLKELLGSGTWDVVTLQQASILSGDSNTYKPYARKLVEYIHHLQPTATIVLHQTWPYRTDAPSFSQISGGGHAPSAEAMWKQSRAAYHTTAAALQLPLIPVGDAFFAAQQKSSTAFKTDQSFKRGQAVFPDLPDQAHSLHVGYFYNKKKELDLDTHHASEAGCYLAGLVWYKFLFGASSVRTTFKPEIVTDEFAKALRAIADDVVSGMDQAQVRR
ncbi:DUF4886 domain-containing protein [Niabella beijingensis]|uniref:DUF4886 domain-containing protein n=1 Tax=Niabella beijingensis TaxID=2872700 RepID=UPI001CBE9569|nr:DUF4886 domain-containing protein [Niabella beijingensis]MBZ4189280.1 DUF4886 domain-containing protein [Niabella beijingensis]